VVDNASERSDFNVLKQKTANIENVRLFRSDKNLGYFGGLNFGISKINITRDIFTVIGNNDLLFPEDFIKSINNKLTLCDTYPVISPNIITLDGTHQNPHVVERISRFRELIYDLYFTNYYIAMVIKTISSITNRYTDRSDELQHEIAQTIYQGYGACYVLTPLFFKNFNTLWAPTFLMGEELFLSKQLEGKGFKVFYEPSIVVKHCLHATMGKLPGKNKWKIERESHKIYRKYVKVWN
jgi:GT2 family glycosyltransferase